jgi:hypothetical protein
MTGNNSKSSKQPRITSGLSIQKNIQKRILEDIQDPELPGSELYTKIGIIENQINILALDSVS